MPFAKLLEQDGEAALNDCVRLVHSIGVDVWEEELDGDGVELVLAQLAQWMKHQPKSRTAWLSARLYCALANVNGADAHRVCDVQFARMLLQIMRVQAGNAQLQQDLQLEAANSHKSTTHRVRSSSAKPAKAKKRASAAHNDDDDDDGSSGSSNSDDDSDQQEDDEDYNETAPARRRTKRAKATLAPEVARDWAVLFRTMATKLDTYLDDIERVEVFVHLAGKMGGSSDALAWLKLRTVKGSEFLLHALLRDTLLLANTNQLDVLQGESSSAAKWMLSALHALAKADEYYLLAFSQRLAMQCDVTTQAQRTSLAAFILRCCSSSLDSNNNNNNNNTSPECKRRMESFMCQEAFHAHGKAGKRLLACELLPSFVPGSKPSLAMLKVLSQRTRDTAAAVRCAALRSLYQLAQTYNVLLVRDTAQVLTAALEAARYDAKPVVRRWAIKLLALVPDIDAEVAKCCMERLRDVSVICRKAALEAVGGMLTRHQATPASSSQPLPAVLVELFHRGLLPACQDEDANTRKHAIDMCRSLLCLCADEHAVALLYAVRTAHEIQSLQLVLATGSGGAGGVVRDLQQRMIAHVLASLPSEDADVDRPVVWSSWLVLVITFEHSPPMERHLSTDFLFQAWLRVKDMISLSDQDAGGVETHALQQRVCRVLAMITPRLSLDQRGELGSMLLGELVLLTHAPSLVSEMLNTLVVLSRSAADDDDEKEDASREIIANWAYSLKQACEEFLLAPQREVAHVDNALYLLGELAMLGTAEAAYISFASTTDNEEEGEDSCVTLIQAFCSPDFVEPAAVPASCDAPRGNSRAFALVALGKLCLRDAVLAKRCTVLFVKQLGGSGEEDYVLRCNVLAILGDLGRRYTNLVEPFVDNQISRCLGDAHVQVRLRCMQTLHALLAEEYIKMRPRLFYRVLAALQDRHAGVAELAAEVLTAFHAKEPSTFFHLAGSGMVLAMNNQASFTAGGGDVLAGVQPRFLAASRLAVYTFVFAKLSEVQVLECANKIRRDVWGALLDGSLGLDRVDVQQQQSSNLSRVVMDVFQIVEQVARCGGGAAGGGGDELDDDEEEENSNAANRGGVHSHKAAATSKVLDSLERANMANNVLPTLIALYQVSSKAKSSLVKPVLDHLEFLQERFNSECATALAPHRDIQAVLKMKREQQQQVAAGATTATTAKPAAASAAHSAVKRKRTALAT